MASFLRVVSCNVASYTGNGGTVNGGLAGFAAGGAALSPEIIALIRCPTSQAPRLPQYCSMGTVNDHHSDDLVELLARNDLSAQRISLDVSFISLPAVAASVTLADGSQVALCSLHLPPSTENERELFVDSIRNVLERVCNRIVLMGGFNSKRPRLCAPPLHTAPTPLLLSGFIRVGVFIKRRLGECLRRARR